MDYADLLLACAVVWIVLQQAELKKLRRQVEEMDGDVRQLTIDMGYHRSDGGEEWYGGDEHREKKRNG